jgi:hypothetical protein
VRRGRRVLVVVGVRNPAASRGPFGLEGNVRAVAIAARMRILALASRFALGVGGCKQVLIYGGWW